MDFLGCHYYWCADVVVESGFGKSDVSEVTLDHTDVAVDGHARSSNRSCETAGTTGLIARCGCREHSFKTRFT